MKIPGDSHQKKCTKRGGRVEFWFDYCVVLCRKYYKMWLFCVTILDIFAVVPFAGTWIEMLYGGGADASDPVVPFAGTWIEIMSFKTILLMTLRSFPSRERGLKSLW